MHKIVLDNVRYNQLMNALDVYLFIGLKDIRSLLKYMGINIYDYYDDMNIIIKILEKESLYNGTILKIVDIQQIIRKASGIHCELPIHLQADWINTYPFSFPVKVLSNSPLVLGFRDDAYNIIQDAEKVSDLVSNFQIGDAFDMVLPASPKLCLEIKKLEKRLTNSFSNYPKY